MEQLHIMRAYVMLLLVLLQNFLRFNILSPYLPLQKKHHGICGDYKTCQASHLHLTQKTSGKSSVKGCETENKNHARKSTAGVSMEVSN